MRSAMTTPPQARRRVWRVALLAVTGAAVAGAVAVYADRRLRNTAPTDPRPEPPPTPTAEISSAESSRAPRRSRTRVRTVTGLAVVAVLAGATAVAVAANPDAKPAAVEPPRATPTPMPLVSCQAEVLKQWTNNSQPDCGYSTVGARHPNDQPPADLTDPRYVGAALPAALASDGAACATGEERPVLETVFPKLTASFTEVPGLTSVRSTFQVRGLGRAITVDLLNPGQPTTSGLAGELDFHLIRQLEQGETYRWRIRGTPPHIAADDWSPWCEFTIAEKTRDHLGLTEDREYPVELPVGDWRTVLTAMGPVITYAGGQRSTHEPIEKAVKKASRKTKRITMTLTGADWSEIVNGLASRASGDEVPEYWTVADAISSALGSHPHPTMGFPRPGQDQPA
jgi:hypothetical protein